MERENRGLGALRRSHRNKAETAWAATSTLNREIDLGDITVRGKQVLQLAFGCGSGEIADI